MLASGDGKQRSFRMARVCFSLMLAAAATTVLPAIAWSDDVRTRHVIHVVPRHYHYAANPYPYRTPGVILTEVATLPFYGTFGGYEDTYWAARYPGPVERRYYGYGWDPRLRF
jgi:hypothetical protein